MQLIFETEPTVDIKRTMTTLDDSLANKLVNGLSDNINDKVCDGNKENVQKDNGILDALGKATNDLIEDINAGNLFTENDTEQDETSQSVKNLVAAVINDMENENFPFIRQDSVEKVVESHSDSDSSKDKESDAEEVKESTDNEKGTDETLHQIDEASQVANNDKDPSTEETDIQTVDDGENEDSNPTVIENTILLENDRKNEENISDQQENIIQLVDDVENDVSEVSLVQVENKIHCLDDEEMTISDEDKEDRNANTDIIDIPMDDDVPSVKTVDEDSGDAQLITEEAKAIDDELSKKDVANKNTEMLQTEDKKIPVVAMDCDEVSVVCSTDSEQNPTVDLRDDDLTTNDEEVKEIVDANDSNSPAENTTLKLEKPSSPSHENISSAAEKIDVSKRRPSMMSKLSLDILSDDDEEETPKKIDDGEKEEATEKCINIEDDDDVMVIDDVISKDKATEGKETTSADLEMKNCDVEADSTNEDKSENIEMQDVKTETENEATPTSIVGESPTVDLQLDLNEKPKEQPKIDTKKPLLPEKFLQTAKKNLADMTRDDLEEFCILKIVEGVVDRSSLNDIKTKLKTMAQSIEEYRKKALVLTKQNRDLQVVLKSIQEEQKKKTNMPIVPLRITRSVGMQVLVSSEQGQTPSPKQKNTSGQTNRQTKNTNQRAQKTSNNQSIPVPRLVPAQANAGNKTSSQNTANQGKTTSPVNGMKNAPATQKSAEKRTHSRSQSVTVDLTDDEPPAKVATRSSTTPPVRLVPSQNLLAPARQQFGANSSPRKVYIPISGQQGQAIRPGQTIMLKSVPSVATRQRSPAHIIRAPQNTPRPQKFVGRHPAPLPEPMKQYQPPNWKALPPAPELKLSKVENGIVISWKIEGYQDDSYEEIASYQLFAYQETTSPANTALWKKIGDVKALPLPMACTLTQFMAGFKYYFAVRAVDIRSRLGPFSLPGSILLLNKM